MDGDRINTQEVLRPAFGRWFRGACMGGDFLLIERRELRGSTIFMPLTMEGYGAILVFGRL